MKFILAVITVMTAAITIVGQNWQQPAIQNGFHYTYVSGNGSSPDGHMKTSLTIRCIPGKSGNISFFYTVHDSSRIKGFDLGNFEGPNAPAAEKKLVTIKVLTRKGEVSLKTSVSAGFTNFSEPDAFEFRFGAGINTKKDITRLIDAIIGGGSLISVTVEDYMDSRRILHTDFQTTGASAYVEQIMKACSKRTLQQR